MVGGDRPGRRLVFRAANGNAIALHPTPAFFRITGKTLTQSMLSRRLWSHTFPDFLEPGHPTHS